MVIYGSLYEIPNLTLYSCQYFFFCLFSQLYCKMELTFIHIFFIYESGNIFKYSNSYIPLNVAIIPIEYKLNVHIS